MIREANLTRRAIAAGAYIRMSGREQEKSPAEQREEIAKLALQAGYHIAHDNWFIDEAITGDSTTKQRPGLAALLEAARANRFTVVLAWHTNRISRENPMDANEFYNKLRKAGVGLHTCSEGQIDLEDFTSQLRLLINQEASNKFLSDLAKGTLRGKILNAKRGDWNGGPVPYGMQRGEFDSSGERLIRRLEPGERPKKGNRMRLLPSDDKDKLGAIIYAFHRFDTAHLSYRQLARELQGKGYPPPRGKGWTRDYVRDLLTNCIMPE